MAFIEAIKAAKTNGKEKVFLFLTDLGVGREVVFVGVVFEIGKLRDLYSASKHVHCEDYHHHRQRQRATSTQRRPILFVSFNVPTVLGTEHVDSSETATSVIVLGRTSLLSLLFFSPRFANA